MPTGRSGVNKTSVGPLGVTSSQAFDAATPGTRHELDYAIEDYVKATTPEQMKALADPTRITILSLLLERAATTTHLAAALDKPKGTVGYHLNVLADTGLIRVVRTRKVRAMTEKYYGRVGRTIVYASESDAPGHMFMLQEAANEAVVHGDDSLPFTTLRRARIPSDRALEFSQRVLALAEEFVSLPRDGDTVYGFVAGVYPTEHPVLGDYDADDD